MRGNRIETRSPAERRVEMAKHIGIVGCSAEGAALCYRTICTEAPQYLAEHEHPEVTMHTFPLSQYMAHIRKDQWREVAGLMFASARKLAQVGAEFAICPDNTIHQAFEFVSHESPLPWLHIAQVVSREAALRGFARLGVIGTRYLMEGPVYPKALEQYGIASEIPAESDRERINAIIFGELVNGVFSDASRFYFNEVIEKLKKSGCDAIVLGCTEIPLIVRPEEASLPTLDSTRLLARAALKESLGIS
jgi:aspartate racemase